MSQPRFVFAVVALALWAAPALADLTWTAEVVPGEPTAQQRHPPPSIRVKVVGEPLPARETWGAFVLRHDPSDVKGLGGVKPTRAIPYHLSTEPLGLVPADGALAFTVSIPLVSWGLRKALAVPIGRAFSAADALSGEGRRYLALIRTWEAAAPSAPRLVALRERLLTPRPASTELARLKRLIDLADLRWSHLPHFFIHSATAWDVHVAAAL